jgi:hypothetical protein
MSHVYFPPPRIGVYNEKPNQVDNGVYNEKPNQVNNVS